METLVNALLCAGVALVAAADTEPFPLGGNIAWGLGTDQYESVRDRTQGWQKKDTTECYTGNELYSQSTVFCDRECLQATDKKDHWRCQGPWYCAKTEVGQEFSDDMDSHGANWKRANVMIRGCANISQCFPGASDADVDESTYEKLADGWETTFGGVKMKSYCCTNKRGYDYVTDEPCNGASRPRRVLAALAALAGPWLLLA